MASISKPPGTKNWIIQFYFDGKKYRKSLKVATKRDALQLQQLIERRLAEGTFDPSAMLQKSQRITHLAQLIEAWKNLIQRKKDIKDATRVGYLYAADLLLEICENKPLSLINPGYVQDDILIELGELYESIDTQASKMSVFRNIFSYAVRQDIVPKNPFSGMVPRIEQGKPVFFRKEEIDLFINYWKDPVRPKWAQTYFVTLLNTGNRMTEHFNLKWSENIFMDEKIIRFLGKGRYKGHERIVNLNDAAFTELFRAQRMLGEDRLFWQINSKEAIKSAWQRFKEKTNFPHKLHNCRSNHASHMIMNGESVEKVMSTHGWKNYKTFKRYSDLSKDVIIADRNVVNWG